MRLSRRTGIALQRRSSFVVIVAVVGLLLGDALAAPPPVAAASCVTIVGATWNPTTVVVPGPGQNEESVRIRNTCTTTRRIGGWILHDYARRNTFVFPSGFAIGPGVTVTVRSICTDCGYRASVPSPTATSRYWVKRYGIVWGGRSPDRVYLRTATGALVSTRSRSSAPDRPPCPSAGLDPTSGIDVLDCFPGPYGGLPNEPGSRASDQTQATPYLAVSANRVVVADVDLLTIYTRSGTLLQSANVHDIFRGLYADTGGYGFTMDRVMFDPTTRRFFAVVMGGQFGRQFAGDCAGPVPCQSAVFIAVSKTDAPSSLTATDWYLYALDGRISRLPSGTIEEHNGFIDDPIPSVYRDWFVISSTVMGFVGEPFIHRTQLRVIPLAPLLRGAPVTAWRDFVDWPDPVSGQQSFRVQPALMDSDAPTLYLVGHQNCGFNLWSLDLAVAQPTPRVWTVPEPSTGPGCGSLTAVPQPGSGFAHLDPGDTAQRSYPVYLDGHLWVTKTNGASSGDGTGVARWLEVDLSGGLDHAAVVQDGVEQRRGAWVTYGSIMPEPGGRVILAFQLGSASIYSGVAAAAREPSDAPGTLRPPLTLKAGTVALAETGSFNNTGHLADTVWFGTTSLALDPVDGSVWAVGQYTGDATRWTTWITHLQ